MRGKACSMDGLGEQPDFVNTSGFYVPGERHENLPAGGFARANYATMGRAYYGKRRKAKGMGTPVYSIWQDTRPPEYATGSSGMFQGQPVIKQGARAMADFGRGNLIAMSSCRG